MSQENTSCRCPRCDKECKDKRGLSVHLKKCENSKPIICEYCNQEFSRNYSLSLHLTRCKAIKQQNTEKELAQKEDLNKLLCEKELHTKYLQDKLNEQEAIIKTHAKQLEDLKLQFLKDYEQQLKMRDDDINKYHSDLNTATQDLKKKDKDNEKLERELNEKKIEYQTIFNLYSKLSLKDTTTTNIINNDNRVQLQSLDPSMIQGRINPPGFVIGNVNDLVRMLRTLGVRNSYRVNDKSRGTLSWNKPGEGEIRDPNGEQLLCHIIDSLDTDLTKEKCYYEEELKKLYKAEERDQYLINEAHDFVSFCTSLLRKDPNILKEIKRQLVKQGRDKNDPQVDEIREVSYNKFINSIGVALFPKIYEWNEMTFFELGRHLGKKAKDYYHLEGASREKLYIVVHTDNNNNKQIFSDKLTEYISEAIERFIDNQTLDQILTEALLHKPNQKERAEAMATYILNPTLKETEEIMRGMVSV